MRSQTTSLTRPANRPGATSRPAVDWVARRCRSDNGSSPSPIRFVHALIAAAVVSPLGPRAQGSAPRMWWQRPRSTVDHTARCALGSPTAPRRWPSSRAGPAFIAALVARRPPRLPAAHCTLGRVGRPRLAPPPRRRRPRGADPAAVALHAARQSAPRGGSPASPRGARLACRSSAPWPALARGRLLVLQRS